jgi:S-adenosylmethionine-diacylglycerol 3-amino-3-carboxypropyl transferase
MTPMVARPPARTPSRARFDFIRYASVWEDADILCEALAPCAASGRVLSIASAGDNALALLTLDPEELVAVDLSGPQLAATELRVVAFRRLEHPELLSFLGVRESRDRLRTYRALRSELSEPARRYWDGQDREIDAGPIHMGKFERYLRKFRRFVLPLVHSRATIRDLLTPKAAAERERFYEERWNTRMWRLVFRLFFSRSVMGRLGRDPEFFAHVEGTVGDRILARTRHALAVLPTHDNPYLTYIMTGSFADETLPCYLRPEHFHCIRDRLDRLRLRHGAAHEVEGRFDAFNLSDIFEYMSREEHELVYGALVDRAGMNARLAYWNLLAPRGIPPKEKARVRPLDHMARELHDRDRAWFYGAFHVDEVCAVKDA